MKSIILGIKKGLSISLIPPKFTIFYNHVFTRLFRIIGGLSVLITLYKLYDKINLNNYFPEIFSEIIIFGTYIFAFIFLIFYIVFSIIKIYYGIYLLIKKPEIFEVRNSPLNFFATHVGKILICIKVGCVASGSTAAVLAGGLTYDTVLEKCGRDPIFIPIVAEGLNLILGKPTRISDIKIPEIKKEDITTDFNKDIVNEVLNNYKNLSITEKEKFWSEVAKEF